MTSAHEIFESVFKQMSCQKPHAGGSARESKLRAGVVLVQRGGIEYRGLNAESNNLVFAQSEHCSRFFLELVGIIVLMISMKYLGPEVD